MADLSGALSALPAQLVPLREATKARFYLYIGQRALAWVRIAQEECRTLEQGVQRAHSALSSAQKELTLLVEAAEADLGGVLAEELLAVARHSGLDLEQLLQLLEPKLDAALGRWSEQHTERLAEFAERLDVEWTARSQPPPAARLSDVMDPAPEPSPPEKPLWDLPDAKEFDQPPKFGPAIR
jgi:hypothetical protein